MTIVYPTRPLCPQPGQKRMRWVASYWTDIRKTFERTRRLQALQALAKAKEVV